MKYQLLAVGPAAARCAVDLQIEFKRQIADIGLDPDIDAELINVANAPDVMQVDWQGAPVGIWFGDSGPFSQDAVNLVDDLMKRGHPVFPVCESTTDYTKKVPKSLAGINGQPWSEPEDKTTIVANALAGFQLTPRDRNVFISYGRVAALRDEMLNPLTQDYIASVFIGGKDGIIDEFNRFGRGYPGVLPLPLHSVGGAS